MESRGAVNEYVPCDRDPRVGYTHVFTINLAAGVTPFMLTVDGKQYTSFCYRLASRVATVTRAWYRPTASQFASFANAWLRDHVLNGGLLEAPLTEAMQLQLAGDPVSPDWDYERFQAWCLETYGRRLPPLENS